MQIARTGLQPATRRGTSAEDVGAAGTRIPDSEWALLTARVRQHRIVGLLAAAVDDGSIELSTRQLVDLRELHRHVLDICIRLEEHLLTVTGWLGEGGVEVRVIKGSATAHLDYPDPCQRTFSDVDILVRSTQYDEAVQLLEQRCLSRRYPEARPGFDRRFGKGVCMTGPSRLETDLHRTFVMGPYGLWIDLDRVWATSESFRLADQTLNAPDVTVRFVHACYHAALGDRTPRLAQLRDVAELLIGTRARVDWDHAMLLASEWRGEAVVARAIRLAWDGLGLVDDERSQWARGRVDGAADRRLLRSYLDPQLGYAARSVAAVGAVDGFRNRVAYTWALTFPRRAYGSGRDRWRLRRLRRALGEAGHLLGRRP